MGGMVILLGMAEDDAQAWLGLNAALEYQTMLADWPFSPRSLGRERPGAIIADADRVEYEQVQETVMLAKRRWGDTFPVLAVTGKSKFMEVAALLECGVAAVLPRRPEPGLLRKKLEKCLADHHNAATTADEAEEELPAELAMLFANPRLLRLGDIADINPGAAPRHARYRRMAPPDHDWRGVITGSVMDRFSIAKPDTFLRWSRIHLFRMPGTAEFNVQEKVVLRRAGPPLAAAVDRSRAPAGADVYSLVPRDDDGAGYIACILNSRLMDFYCNRVARVSGDGRLRLEYVKNIPVPQADAATVQDLGRSAALLAHYGANPQSWIDRQSRDELLEHMEDAVFSLYGATSRARDQLAAMHF